MSGIALAAVLLIGGAIFAAEIWIVVRIARRLVPMARRLADPAQRAALLSDDTREALRDAGYDVATLDHAALARTPELKARVDAELRDALKAAWRGALPGLGRRGAHPAPPAFAATPPTAHSAASRPRPIDDPGAHRARGVLALGAIAALAIGAALWFVA